MTDCTVAAPVRATKAPARSKAAPSPAPTQPPLSESDKLAAEAMQFVSVLVSAILELDDSSVFGASEALFSQADDLASTLGYGDDIKGPVPVAQGEISLLSAILENALETLESTQGVPEGTLFLVASFTHQALDVLQRIADALEVAPATLEPLRALGSYAGVRPHRDRPTPPIRRAPAATHTITRNDPGEIHFNDREDLERFVSQGASMLSSLNVCLSSLVNGIGKGAGPDYGFIADFSTHVSDLTYEHQNALDLLFAKGGAA